MFVGNGMDIFAMLQEAKGKCPKCGNILYRKKGKDAVLQCLEKDCGYQRKE